MRAFRGVVPTMNALKSRWGASIGFVLLMSSVCAAQSNSKTEDIASRRSIAETGDPKQQYELGGDYYFGTHGVPKDRAEAFKWLRKAAENGDGETQRAVAFLFQNDGSVGSEREAIYWYMKSGAQRNFLAISNLYSYCVSGKLTQQDCSDVLKWLREIASSPGTQATKAPCDLGTMYEKGLGTYRSYPEAAQWYRTCANQGLWEGQMELGFLYADGKGVPKDLVLAYMWLNLAAASAPQNDFVSMANDIAKQRDALASTMTREQIAEAQRLSREWKPGKE